MQLNKKAFGFTFGLLAGIFWLIIMLVSLITDYLREIIILIGSLHPLFSYSLLGALWMGIFHFICGFIIGWLFAWIYNKLAKN
jgi:fructose-specific phosphotransferase system IIC component